MREGRRITSADSARVLSVVVGRVALSWTIPSGPICRAKLKKAQVANLGTLAGPDPNVIFIGILGNGNQLQSYIQLLMDHRNGLLGEMLQEYQRLFM